MQMAWIHAVSVLMMKLLRNGGDPGGTWPPSHPRMARMVPASRFPGARNFLVVPRELN
jgi:hypothetical protein